MSDQTVGFNKKHFLRIAIFLSALCMISFCLLLGFRLRNLFGATAPKEIDEVVLTSKLDESGVPLNSALKFSSSTPQIYCVINARDMLGLSNSRPTVVKWYYGSKELQAHLFDMTVAPVRLKLEPPDNETFLPGEYSVKFFVQGTQVKTVTFQIE